MEKVYVEVIAKVKCDGIIIPGVIIWDDGREYRINKIIDACQARTLKSRQEGLRYVCQIKGLRYKRLKVN